MQNTRTRVEAYRSNPSQPVTPVTETEPATGEHIAVRLFSYVMCGGDVFR